MRNANESDQVADLERARAKRAFNNWINGEEARLEFMTSLQVMGEQGVTPGWLRYLMQYAYQNGFREGCAAKGDKDHHGGAFLETEL